MSEVKEITQKTSEYLFGTHDTKELSNLDIRTDIPTKEMFELIHYHQDLSNLGSKASKNIKNSYEQLLISRKRLGRGEGVVVLQGQTAPKVQRVTTGQSNADLKPINPGEGEL